MPDEVETSDANIPASSMIDPDVADELASAFVPVWQFEDVPFSAGAALSNEDIEALGQGAESRRVDTPSSATQSFATTVVDPFAPAAAAPPDAVGHGFDGGRVSRDRRKRLLFGGGAGVAAILGVLVVAFARSGGPVQAADPAPTSQASRAPESVPNSIPPPPAAAIESAVPVAQALPTEVATPEPSPPPPPANDRENAPAREPASSPSRGSAPSPKSPAKPTSRESIARPAPSATAPSTAPPQRRERPAAKGGPDVDFGI